MIIKTQCANNVITFDIYNNDKQKHVTIVQYNDEYMCVINDDTGEDVILSDSLFAQIISCVCVEMIIELLHRVFGGDIETIKRTMIKH